MAATAALLTAGLIYTAAFAWTTWVGWLVLGLGAVITAGIALGAGYAAVAGRSWETVWGDRNGLFVHCPSGVAGVWWEEVAAVGTSYLFNPQADRSTDLQKTEECNEVFLRGDGPLRRHPELQAYAVDEPLPPTEFLFDLEGYLTDLPTRRLRFEGSRTSDLGVAFDYPGVRNIWNSYPRHGPWGNPPTTHPFAPVRPYGPTPQVHPSRRAW